ncbi:acyltransferase-domain-containing protein [Blakeslea trispora]|nr:acyltransferase-domain-containing protein [Blakeslea trispora]
MRMWSQNLVALVQWFAPADIVFTFDSSCGPLEDILETDKQGNTTLKLPHRAIITANHQIYADWIYIWCIAYLAKAHGVMKIILKASLKHLPVYGLGMQFFDFIFLKRKLASDKDTIVSNLERSKKSNQPMWLVLFPEGTVIAEDTRKRSKAYAEKSGLQDNRYTLLPRSTGLRLCTSVLKGSVDYVYDLTIGYEGIEANDIPEKVYTIQSIFFFRHFPKKIHVHMRRFSVDSMPIDNEQAFHDWNIERWIEKDQLMAQFYQTKSFSDNTVILPIRLTDSVINLAQLWIFMLPYAWMAKQIL